MLINTINMSRISERFSQISFSQGGEDVDVCFVVYCGIVGIVFRNMLAFMKAKEIY